MCIRDSYHAIDLRLPGRSPCPLAVTVHDLIPWAWGGPRMRGERLRYWLGKRLLKRADVVIASRGQRRQMRPALRASILAAFGSCTKPRTARSSRDPERPSG